MKLDIQDLKDRLDVLEGTTITSINEQISAINTSISDLKEMDESFDTYIKALEATATDLQKQIDDANAEIAKVEAELGEEISVLEQTLLNELNTAKEAIEAELLAINNTLAELKQADEALDKKISDLQAYVDTQLTSTTNWANATFSTLAQYEQTQTEISTIKASIEQINAGVSALETRLNGKIASDIQTAIDALRSELSTDYIARIESAVNTMTQAYTTAISSAKDEITSAYTNAIAKAIAESETNMQAWVNSVLTQGYYDIATIDGKLSALAARLDETDADLQKQITELKTALETSKEELTKAYKSAIKEAIEENNGVINAAIAEAVQKLETKINSRLSTIESQITAMQKGIGEIIDDIDTIQKQIESINFILENLEDVDEELRLLIDKLLSDYAALLQELEDIRPIDEISKKTIVDDISAIKTLIGLIQDRLGKLETDFVNRIQSLKYMPEYSDRKVEMSDVFKSVSLDFLVSPTSQAMAIQQAWVENKEVVKAYLRTTKSPATRVVNSAISLNVKSVVGSADGILTVTMIEDTSHPIDAAFLTGNCDAVIYVNVSDKNSDVFSDIVDIICYVDDFSYIEDLTLFEDLSPQNNGIYQTANCYIVSEPGYYKFRAYKGNSQYLAGNRDDIHPEGNPVKADVLWESFGTSVAPNKGDLIQRVGYRDGYIAFQVPPSFKNGNSLIVVRDDSETILWSWHIWNTKQPTGQEYYNNAGTMMDRNLGATSNVPGDVEAFGLRYQWGRKDPFMGYGTMKDESEAKATKEFSRAYVSDNSSYGTIEYSILNPTTKIDGDTNNWDWYYTGSSATDNTRWTTSEYSKSIYDPCPYGWRVPDGGPYGLWSVAAGVSEITDDLSDSINCGINFSGIFGNDNVIWYPIGYNTLTYWSATPKTNNRSAYGLSLYLQSNRYNQGLVEADLREFCNYIRCVKED
ncbi:MAG: hypothetical protein IKV05_00115 [Bacteroidales bacterium]|nr:hypothetical protein [Bacteroidales bacterium]